MTPEMWKAACGITRTVAGSLSAVASIGFIMYMMVVFRTRFFNLPNVRFLTYLQLYILGASLNHILTVYTAYYSDQDWVCITQAFINQYVRKSNVEHFP